MATTKHVIDASLKITEYIDALPEWSQKICKRLRTIILKADPKIIEDWKWGPNYYLEGMVCGYTGLKKEVNLVFFQGVLLKDKRKILKVNEGSVRNRFLRFSDVKEINEDILLEYLFEAIDNNKKGKKLRHIKNKTLTIPADIKKAFKLANILGYFESLAYSHKKEYLFWIESAKREETRKSRIEKAIVKLSAKEMLHDKYKK